MLRIHLKQAGIIWIHGLIILLIWLSPFLFHWLGILIGIALYVVQIIIVGDCILTRKQFGVKKRGPTFYYYLLVKLGFHPDMQRVRWISDYIMPVIIFLLAMMWQVVLHHQPFVK